MSRNASPPSLLEMRTSSIGHMAGAKLVVESADCLWHGTKRLCHVGMRRSFSIISWPPMEAKFRGVSSHTGRIKTTTIQVVSLASENARAWMIARSMSSGLHSGLAIQEFV
jgi:hypothetical protein